ncbi:MAG: ABC transporter ATP-binding protein [Bacteroides sp.]|nr:ABC transporter ATP-binding protein [Bacteroides sp.]
MIQIEKLSFSYSRKGNPALDGITAAVGPGIHLLIGENGAGKTTLLHLMAGVALPSSGSIRIDATDPSSDHPDEKGHTFLLEENTSVAMKTIRKFAEAHSRFYPNFSHKQFCDNLHTFGLTGDEPIRKLSLGNRKKTLLAYALALGVDLLLLDEPTNALDIQSKEQLKGMIARNISDNQTVVVSTHTISELENLFDGAMILRGGRLLWTGSAEMVSDRLAFERSRFQDEDALYTEQIPGGYVSILPAIQGAPTNVDWRMLYSALYSPACDAVLSHLNDSRS